MFVLGLVFNFDCLLGLNGVFGWLIVLGVSILIVGCGCLIDVLF